MNVLRSHEMLRLAASIGRFAVRSQIRTGVRKHLCSNECPLGSSRTSPSFTFSSVRYLCQQEAQTPTFKEGPDEHLGLQVPALMSSWSEETPKKEVRSTFYPKLQECRSPTDVLDLVDQCNLAHWSISSGLTRMWQTTKKMSDEQRRCELRLMAEHPTFERLCHRARTNAPRMLSHDLAFTLLALVKLGVSQGSFVVQTVLRVIQERLNDFEDEKALSILAACLAEMEPSKNAEALKEGLKLVLEDRIPTIQSVMLLHTMMRLFGKEASPAVKQKLEAKALSMTDTFSLPNAQYMLDTLATMRLNSKPLLDTCSKKLAENVHSIPFTRLMALLKACRELRYRNLSLFTSISDYLASTLPMWSNKQMLLILLEFKGLRFRPVALLDAFAERVIQKPDSLTLRDLLGVLKSYSFLNHHLKENHQEFLRSVTQVLESYLSKMSGMELLRAVSCLCVFGHFPQAPLEKMLQEETLNELLQKGGPVYARVERMLHTLDLCVRLDEPPLPPSASPIPPLHRSLSPHELPANPALIGALKGLVGEDAVTESVIREGIYFIDCVITVPPKTKESSSLHEEQRGPSEEPTRIAVLCVSPSSFCFGTTHPCGALALKIRHLKLLGYNPVLMPLQELDNQTGEERMNMLKKCVLPDQEGCRTENVMENGSGL
ncbi:FAST kinase domain-containing protein 2, mitochondrial [Trichomycterus rosablanca]|uniref:FAST kinase domain-containing protein 2, mitochondrial n=1 Tax=Trichomycterus rosablanca TaxID=2290929 RepID=UPI002F34FF01